MATPVLLHYTERGSGLPVVLLHGFPLDHTIWQIQADALSAQYRVITPDLRGHGHTPTAGAVYTMDLLAQDVLALLDTLGITGAAWAGHSMGGYVTMAALRIAPERLLGAGFVATQPYADTPEKRIQRHQDADRVLAEGVDALANSMLNVLFAPDRDRQSEMAQAAHQIMRATPSEGVAGALRGMAERLDSQETLRTLAVPAAVIAGMDDRLIAPDIAPAFASLIPEATLTHIPGAGHMPMLEQPEATTAALHDWLARI